MRLSLYFLCFLLWVTASAITASAQQQVDFSSQIRPLLAAHCYSCHGPDQTEGSLALNDQQSVLSKNDSGEFTVVPGDPDASELIRRITSREESDQMPPESDPLSEEQIDRLRRWIEQGAKWERHWAFEPRTNPEVPNVSSTPVDSKSVDSTPWSDHPIDAFIENKLASAGLTPNPPADRATLIRRATYDLTGLPPQPQDVESFVKDPDPDAFEKLIDRLLESPHYGERWGRHWLDLVRFAETNSFERDGSKANAWKYRDYVIRSFNNDKPYDQFIREQLAGDELDEVTIESLTATGYYRLGIWDDEPADPHLARFNELDDLVTTTAQAFMGLTINCARCHDHKIDPIPQTDYYKMIWFFSDLTSFAKRSDLLTNNQIDVSPPDLRKQYAESDIEIDRTRQAAREFEQIGIAKMSGADQRRTEISKTDREKLLKKKLKSFLSKDQWEQYKKHLEILRRAEKDRQKLPPRENILGVAKIVQDPGQTFVFFRGNPHSPTDPVQPGFPEVLCQNEHFEIVPPPKSPILDHMPVGRRRTLAEWLTDPQHPLVTRVIVNRLWQFHFGRGIVRTSNNFGLLGIPPTHPELLDWLAGTFVRDQWSIKSMHRRIMKSQTYQMSSAHHASGVRSDPGNDLFWRFNPRRLSAEEVRDSILMVSGDLNRKVFGPSIYPSLSPEVLAGQSRPGEGWGKSSPEDQNRRSIYIYVKRSLLPPLLSEFDYPDPDQTCEARFMTLGPGQSLALMNGDFVHQAARRLSQRWKLAQSNTIEESVKRLIHQVLGRPATKQEIVECMDLVKFLENNPKYTRAQAMQLLALSVLNWNEFLFVD